MGSVGGTGVRSCSIGKHGIHTHMPDPRSHKQGYQNKDHHYLLLSCQIQHPNTIMRTSEGASVTSWFPLFSRLSLGLFPNDSPSPAFDRVQIVAYRAFPNRGFGRVKKRVKETAANGHLRRLVPVEVGIDGLGTSENLPSKSCESGQASTEFFSRESFARL